MLLGESHKSLAYILKDKVDTDIWAELLKSGCAGGASADLFTFYAIKNEKRFIFLICYNCVLVGPINLQSILI